MDKLITINGKSYKAAEFDVNFICDMEDVAGIKLDEIDEKMVKLVRYYVATSMGTDPVTAGKEMTAHINNGGSFEDFTDMISDAMEDSGFFRQKQTNKDQSSQKRTRKKTQESEEVNI